MNNEASSLERQVAPARAHALAVLGAACRDGHFQARQRLVECDLLQLTKSKRTILRQIYTVHEALAAEEFVKPASTAELEDLGFALARFEAAKVHIQNAARVALAQLKEQST
jgi:hypothetical protein